MSEKVAIYHCKETCNRCGGPNEIKITDSEEGLIYECETTCSSCGFNDYWAHGFFMSMQEGHDNCKKY